MPIIHCRRLPLVLAAVTVAPGVGGAQELTRFDGTLRAAVVAAASNTADPQTSTRFTDPRDKILGTGVFDEVDIISTTRFQDGGDLTLFDLSGYDAILTYSNDSHEDAEALGSLLADYVDAGGGVVNAVFGNTSTNEMRQLRGRWLAEGYNLIPYGLDFVRDNGSPASRTIGDRLEPGHPTLDGVQTFSAAVTFADGLGFWGAFRPSTTQLVNGGRMIATWDDGRPLVVVSADRRGVVELGMHPVSGDVNFRYYWEVDSDGDWLLVSSLLFAAWDACPANVDGNLELDIFDLLLWFELFASGDPAADLAEPRGVLDLLDILTYTEAYARGCV